MYLLAGLGNHGASYVHSRHNVGFIIADAVRTHYQFAQERLHLNALCASGMIDKQKILIVKPQTFMNRSGEAIAAVMRFYKLSVAQLFVIHDDLDLACGRIKIKTGGGDGGHRGLRSIDAHCGAEYHRLRVGIGRPAGEAKNDAKNEAKNYVLGNFSKQDEAWLAPLRVSITAHISLWLAGRGAEFMDAVRQGAA